MISNENNELKNNLLRLENNFKFSTEEIKKLEETIWSYLMNENFEENQPEYKDEENLFLLHFFNFKNNLNRLLRRYNNVVDLNDFLK